MNVLEHTGREGVAIFPKRIKPESEEQNYGGGLQSKSSGTMW